MALVKKTAKGFKCKRCEHPWKSRQAPDKEGMVDIIVCPTCKSPWWNKEKKGK